MFSWSQRARKSRQQKPDTSRRPQFERIEDRRVMAGFHSGIFDDLAPDVVEVFELPKAEGSIVYDPISRRVTIEGTPQHNDRVSIVYDTKGTATTADDQLSILLANINSPLVKAFNYADVADILFNGYAGDDSIENKTITPLKVYAGDGNDTVIGGFGPDVLLGGYGNDYIDGRRGDDMMWGEAGFDALFGDDGIDLILGGNDPDTIHGGNGPDSLYGEGSDDWIFGGAATDMITDTVGSNKIYADYGTNTSTITGYYRFDWFDKNLQDPDLRSAVRLVYRDGFLLRDDLLSLFKHVSTDNYVNAAELADLKDLMSTQLATPVDSRFLLGRVVNGDRANGWYHGQTLGNLYDGASGLHLTKLVDKWFKGGDLPAVHDASFRYEKVTGPLFASGATFDDISQGGANDCYFLAALGEIVQHKPSLIQNMFIDNGDGTFAVRFFKGSPSSPFYVTVNSYLPIDASSNSAYAQHERFGTNELWVSLAEKAYAQLNESGWIDQSGANSYSGIDFGQTGKAFSHLSGRSATNKYFIMPNLPELYVQGLLLQDIAAGKAITVSTKDGGVASDVVPNHAYQVVSYDSQTQKFDLYNPHGLNHSSTQPIRLQLTFSQLKANCERWTSVTL